MNCTCGHEVGTSNNCPNCGAPVEMGSRKSKGIKIISVIAVCLVVAGCSGYYWFKTVSKPNQILTIATTFFDNGQESEADEVFRSFISDYPQHEKVAFAYGKLFELNFSDKAKSVQILKTLKESYPSSTEYANSLAKSAALGIDTIRPLYDEYYNTGQGKDKYYSEAKNLLNELNKLSDSSAFIKAGGNDLITKLNAIVNPPFGEIEFKLALSDYSDILSVKTTDEPKVTLTRSDGTSAVVRYDKGTQRVSANDLAPGNYKLDISLTTTIGTRNTDFVGGELLTIVPGRKYTDTTYLFIKNKFSSDSDIIDRRYLGLDNNTQTIAAKQIMTSSDSPVPTEITEAVLPQGYSVPNNDHYLFDLDKDMKNELIAYYNKTRLLAVLHWNGKAFEEQSEFQIGGTDSKLDFSMYPISIKLYNFEGIPYPAFGLITTSGESGSYPELTLFNWNGKDGYNVIWDATAGDHGEWQITKNGFIMSQDNFGVGAHAGDKTRFTQEYEYNGTTFVLTNAYSSTTR